MVLPSIDIHTKAVKQRRAATRRPRKIKASKTRPRWKQPLAHPVPVPIPMVSQDTKDRLYSEAKDHHLFEFMDPANIPGYMDGLIEDYLAKQPWWYGHTGGPGGADARHHASRQQHQARRDKEKDGSAKPRVVHVEEVPGKGGETVTTEREERSLIYLRHNQRKEQPWSTQDQPSCQSKKPPRGCRVAKTLFGNGSRKENSNGSKSVA